MASHWGIDGEGSRAWLCIICNLYLGRCMEPTTAQTSQPLAPEKNKKSVQRLIQCKINKEKNRHKH